MNIMSADGQRKKGSTELLTLYRAKSILFIGLSKCSRLAVNPVFHMRSKHIAITFHWVREHVNPDR